MKLRDNAGAESSIGHEPVDFIRYSGLLSGDKHFSVESTGLHCKIMVDVVLEVLLRKVL